MGQEPCIRHVSGELSLGDFVHSQTMTPLVPRCCQGELGSPVTISFYAQNAVELSTEEPERSAARVQEASPVLFASMALLLSILCAGQESLLQGSGRFLDSILIAEMVQRFSRSTRELSVGDTYHRKTVLSSWITGRTELPHKLTLAHGEDEQLVIKGVSSIMKPSTEGACFSHMIARCSNGLSAV